MESTDIKNLLSVVESVVYSALLRRSVPSNLDTRDYFLVDGMHVSFSVDFLTGVILHNNVDNRRVVWDKL